MKFNKALSVYGDVSFRGVCPPESAEQKTLFTEIRRRYPDSLGLIALHPRNEGVRHWSQAAIHTAEGMVKGAADLIIPGCPAFVCELKRRDHTQSKWESGQQEYLLACQSAGAFVCVALGWESAIKAITEWESIAKQYFKYP